MKTFSGFPPGKVRSASIPEPVFTELIPIVDDLAELKLTLHVLWRLGQQRGKVRYLRRADLVADQVLLSGLGDAPAEMLSAALERAVERGTLLLAQATIGETSEELCFANTARGRAAVEAIDWSTAVLLHELRRLSIEHKRTSLSLYPHNVSALQLRQAATNRAATPLTIHCN